MPKKAIFIYSRVIDYHCLFMLTFDELQRQANEKYYKRRGRKLYSDFKTFGGSDKIAIANAIEFYAWLENNQSDRRVPTASSGVCAHSVTTLQIVDAASSGVSNPQFVNDLGHGNAGDEIKVYDFGIGNGFFSKFFLQKLYLLDRARKFVPRLSYFLCDISGTLVRRAERDLRQFNVHGIVCDATGKMPFLKRASYIRSNELYDDLPAKIFVKRDGVTFEVYMDGRTVHSPETRDYVKTSNRAAISFMKNMPDGYEIPLNFGAASHLSRCMDALVVGGYIDIFDYGFSSIKEITALPAEVWNNSIVREFNSQLTVDVNFIHLAQAFKNSEAAASAQKSYAESVLGKKLFYVELEQLYYFEKAEVRSNAKRMARFGYPKDFLSSGIRETEDYKHFRVVKCRNYR